MKITLPILMYHQVRPAGVRGFDPHIDVTPEDLERQLRQLKDGGWDFVTLSEAGRRIEAGVGGGAVALTFDDATTLFFDHALPLLRTFGVAATAFVVAGGVVGDPVDNPPHGDYRWLGEKDLVALRGQKVEIGSHAWSHAELHRMRQIDLETELQRSRMVLGKLSGTNVQALCYPRGRFTERVVHAAQVAGYGVAVSTQRGCRQDPEERFHLKRIRMSGRRVGLRLRYALTAPYDWMQRRRGKRERAAWAQEEAWLVGQDAAAFGAKGEDLFDGADS